MYYVISDMKSTKASERAIEQSPASAIVSERPRRKCRSPLVNAKYGDPVECPNGLAMLSSDQLSDVLRLVYTKQIAVEVPVPARFLLKVHREINSHASRERLMQWFRDFPSCAEVRDAGEKGVGVYATTVLDKGKTFAWYAGFYLPTDEVDNESGLENEIHVPAIPSDRKIRVSYKFDGRSSKHEGDWVLFGFNQPVDMGILGDYNPIADKCNHSCDANSQLVNDVFTLDIDGESFAIDVVLCQTTRTVQAGEELTVDYGNEMVLRSTLDAFTTVELDNMLKLGPSERNLHGYDKKHSDKVVRRFYTQSYSAPNFQKKYCRCDKCNMIEALNYERSLLNIDDKSIDQAGLMRAAGYKILKKGSSDASLASCDSADDERSDEDVSRVGGEKFARDGSAKAVVRNARASVSLRSRSSSSGSSISFGVDDRCNPVSDGLEQGDYDAEEESGEESGEESAQESARQYTNGDADEANVRTTPGSSACQSACISSDSLIVFEADDRRNPVSSGSSSSGDTDCSLRSLSPSLHSIEPPSLHALEPPPLRPIEPDTLRLSPTKRLSIGSRQHSENESGSQRYDPMTPGLVLNLSGDQRNMSLSPKDCSGPVDASAGNDQDVSTYQDSSPMRVEGILNTGEAVTTGFESWASSAMLESLPFPPTTPLRTPSSSGRSLPRSYANEAHRDRCRRNAERINELNRQRRLADECFQLSLSINTSPKFRYVLQLAGITGDAHRFNVSRAQTYSQALTMHPIPAAVEVACDSLSQGQQRYVESGLDQSMLAPMESAVNDSASSGSGLSYFPSFGQRFDVSQAQHYDLSVSLAASDLLSLRGANQELGL